MYDSSIIKIYKPSLSKIERFNIFIYPKPNFQGRNVGERYFITPEYTIKDPKSNYFQIEIPELTYEYMTYIRLNKEYIKVIDINHFEWHGEIYSRQK